MTKQQFLTDLQTIYDALQRRQAELNDYYMLLKGGHDEADEVVSSFLKLLKLERNEDTMMAALTRMVSLREDALEQVLGKAGFSDDEIRVKKELAYGFVSMMHISRHERFIGWIEEQKLLTPFYRSLIFGVHFVGLRLSEWQSRWSAHILHDVNLHLSTLFDGDDAKVFEMLQANSLLDKDESGNVADRSYSVLIPRHSGLDPESRGISEGILNQAQDDGERMVQGLELRVQKSRHSGLDPESPVESEGILNQVQDDGGRVQDDGGENSPLSGYRSASYAEAFPDEVAAVTAALDQLIALLEQHKDEIYNQKHEWIAYFTALREAFAHTVVDELIGKWAQVDRSWMAITTPIQVGHPLEYYEDHYRKAVALEWDLRIVNPKLQSQSSTRENIKLFAHQMAQKLGDKAMHTITKNLLQVDATQLYIGQPMLYYAAEFNGLFSAQVVPNDEQVSHELGKKIFAYADFVLQSKLAKPVMQLSVETMGEDFVRASRMMAERNPALWHRIYDISTIGHEFGHILWIDSDTEATMNVTGQFKNIEEFKATAGGLMAFFHHEDAAMTKHLTDDLVGRAVGLIAWQQVGEVLPYYCEGLIHLEILFASRAIKYDGQKITINYDRYPEMKAAYIEAYENLAAHYIAKRDAAEYLGRYTTKEGSIYLPLTPEVCRFVEHYYARYEAIGQQVYEGEIKAPEWKFDEEVLNG